jgi:hypothetical protein
VNRAIGIVLALAVGGLVLATLSLPVINEPGRSSVRLNDPNAPRVLCSKCEGSCKAQCAVCVGFGTVESPECKPCPHCDGAGLRSKQLSEGSAPCPFCNGRGTTREHVRIRCPKCWGYGFTHCPECAGSGYVAAAPPPSTFDRILSAVNGWFDSVSGRATRLSQIKSD